MNLILVNSSTSAKVVFLLEDNAPQKRSNIVARILNYQQKEFPINYLGCPLFCGKKRVHYFTYMALANFFWGNSGGKQKYHWTKWETLCKPTQEGGIGIRKLEDIADALSCKLWWHFRTKDTLWTKFMRAKYSQRIHPMARKWNYTHSHT
ncbi:hypothetical protein H5410_037905 [Solanum commersonii]|uniref:Uncharacterized protein n=1 Tax=Solanum commersonii TaxID=4109 RepID=A0A9J5Y8J1_SOLCO|nr:hypothetical protein H5410_037905 [Solanum commersonii]